MQVVNLDKIVTRKDKVIILDGVEHVMRTPTVKDYIVQMKKAEQIQTLSETPSIESATKLLEITIETLMLSFPTIPQDTFESLNMDQLNALRALAEGELEAEATGGAEGEAAGATG